MMLMTSSPNVYQSNQENYVSIDKHFGLSITNLICKLGLQKSLDFKKKDKIVLWAQAFLGPKTA